MVSGKIVSAIQSQTFAGLARIAGSFACSTGLVRPGRVWLVLGFQGEVSIGNPDLTGTGVFVCPGGCKFPLIPDGSNSTPVIRQFGGVYQVSGGGVGLGGRAIFSPGVFGNQVPTGSNPLFPIWLREGWQLVFQVAGSPAQMVVGVSAVLTVMYADLSVMQACKLL